MSKPPPSPPRTAPTPERTVDGPRWKDQVLAEQRRAMLRVSFLFFGAAMLVACDNADDAPAEYAVGTAAYHLVDSARAEPETPDAADHRELMVRASFPAQASSAPPAGYFSTRTTLGSTPSAPAFPTTPSPP